MKLLVSGCSFTQGHGLDSEERDPKLWVNQLASKLQCNSVNNIARPGYNNQTIFLETLHELTKNTYDIAIVAWSVIPRYNFTFGFELYKTFSRLSKYQINTNQKTFSTSWQENLRNKLLETHNDHWNLLELVKYVNIFIAMQQCSKIKNIFFVNTFGPWSDDFFTKTQINLPSDLCEYTQSLLNVENRDDDEIFKLYDLMHQQYKDAGGIQEQNWLNLYDNSFKKLKIDSVSEIDNHPGYASQDVFVDRLWPILKEKLQ